MYFLHLLIALTIVKINAWPDPPCRTPTPASNYTIDKVIFIDYLINNYKYYF